MGLVAIVLVGASLVFLVGSVIACGVSGGSDGEDTNIPFAALWKFWLVFAGPILLVAYLVEKALQSVVGGW